jgi:hypothetical protein
MKKEQHHYWILSITPSKTSISHRSYLYCERTLIYMLSTGNLVPWIRQESPLYKCVDHPLLLGFHVVYQYWLSLIASHKERTFPYWISPSDYRSGNSVYSLTQNGTLQQAGRY